MRKHQWLALLASILVSTNAYSLFGPKIDHSNCNIKINKRMSQQSLEELQLKLHDKGFYVIEEVNKNLDHLNLDMTVKQDWKFREVSKRHTNTFVIHRSELSDFRHRYNGTVKISKRRHVNARYGYIYVELVSYSKKRETTASICQVRSVYKNNHGAVVKILEKNVKLKDKNDYCRNNYLEVIKKVKIPKCRI
ncbi:MAG: hypothetical protein GY909_09320 [Oligoflexia bacterium]|nr:hypothetical protein [Oligoflexia bacterium]